MEEIGERKSNLIDAVHNIKETSKRATQFCCAAIVAALFTIITNINYGNILSAVLVAALVLALAFVIWINKKGKFGFMRYGVIIVINSFLVLIAFTEGLDTASTLYFLPLLYAIPFFIDQNKNYKLQLSVFFSITLLSFATCIFFVERTSDWEPIADATAHRMFIINSLCSFFLCATFAYLSIFLERKYAGALLTQIKKTNEAMQARTKFLSNMGHELRTPLNGIVGATNLLRTGETLPQQKEYLDILKYCSDHMLNLVNDILDFNKIEAGQLDLFPVECDLKKLLKQSTLPFYNSFEEKNIELKVNLDEKLNDIVLLDDLRLVQIINNLLSNALKFTEKGSVKLSVLLKEKKDGLDTIYFSVEDTGIGISKDDQKKIFGSFWQAFNETTRKYAGTGLGLTISQRLLKLMNSALMVESKVGKGTNFSFTITVPVIETKEEKLIVVEQKSKDLEGLRILIAEDNIINTMIATKILEDKKAIITATKDGKEALDCLEKDSDYNVILLDLEMPVMDGFTAVKEIRKRYPDIPVLAFTAALMDQEMLQGLLDIGFLDCILKPFQPRELFAKVRKYARSLPAVCEV